MRELIFKPPTNEPKAEYGSCFSVRFADMKYTICDSEGNEIPVPTCKVCGKQMSSIFGKETMAWYCYEHG